MSAPADREITRGTNHLASRPSAARHRREVRDKITKLEKSDYSHHRIDIPTSPSPASIFTGSSARLGLALSCFGSCHFSPSKSLSLLFSWCPNQPTLCLPFPEASRRPARPLLLSRNVRLVLSEPILYKRNKVNQGALCIMLLTILKINLMFHQCFISDESFNRIRTSR